MSPHPPRMGTGWAPGPGPASARQINRTLLLLALPFVLSAQDASKTTLQGRVIDAKTRQPLSGTAIHLSGDQGEHLTESDGEGRFRLQDLAPGAYYATALRSGYDRLHSKTIQITGGDEEHEVELELDRLSVIAGRVLDELGRPVVSADVAVYQQDLEPQMLEPYWFNVKRRGGPTLAFYKGITDDRGEYRFWGLPAGEFVIAAKPSPRPGSAWRLEFDATPSFYPNNDTFEDAARLQLDWGEVREGVDLHLGPPAATLQTGRVLASDAPCARCGFSIVRKGRDSDVQVAFSTTSPNGEIVLQGLAPGEYGVRVSARARQGPRALGGLDFVVSPDGDHPFTLFLDEPVVLRGRVVFEDAPEEIPEPPPSKIPVAQHNFARLLTAARDREGAHPPCQSDTGEFYREGAERFFEMLASPGHCRLSVAGPMGSYVAGVSLDGRPLEEPYIDLPRPGLAEGLTVRIRFDVGEVTGRVDDAQPDTQAHLIPIGDPFARVHSVQVDPDGSFRAAVPPARWAVVAQGLRNRYRPSLEAVEAARSATDGLSRVEVKSGQTTTLTEPLSIFD